MDQSVRESRRSIVQNALNGALRNGTAHISDEAGVQGALLELSKGTLKGKDADTIVNGLVTPAFTTAEANNSGRIYNNYDYMHKLHNDPGAQQKMLNKLRKAGVSDTWINAMQQGLDNTEGFYKGGPSPEVSRYPIMSHELLERKDMLYNPEQIPGNYKGEFKGQAMDAYGNRIDMGHNSMNVLGDESNLALRTMSPEETKVLRDMRRGSGELPTLSAVRNTKDMYEVLLNEGEISPWAKGTSTAVERGLSSGKLLSEAEQAAINAGSLRNTSGSLGRSLREMESAVATPVMSGLKNIANRSKKYLSKLF